jgi:hypothetical protein
MKRFVPLLAVVFVMGLASVVLAQTPPNYNTNYHTGQTLQCTDCHIMHGQNSHSYPWMGVQPPAVVGGPHEYLLRAEPNELCLGCHNGSALAPDVLGTATDGSTRRMGGALNASSHGYNTSTEGYEDGDGHTLWSTAVAPGGTWQDADHGLECVHCHAQHGIYSQYRNLLNRGAFTGKNLTFAVGVTNDLSKDVWEHAARAYNETDVDFNEPNQSASAYANWCKSCHTNFHGTSGGSEVGGQSGGNSTEPEVGWLRHPNADVDIGTDPGLTGSGAQTDSSSFVSSYVARFFTRTNNVKVMSPNGNWKPATSDPRVLTPSCFSCHKAHGNKNGFGLIFMKGDAAAGTPTEEGDGGGYIDLCRQCHSQGSYVYSSTGANLP